MIQPNDEKMTKPYSEMAKEIINSVPESCFSNNSYCEWRRSKEVLALAITKALEAVAKERDEEIERIVKKDDLSNFYEWEIQKHATEYEVEFQRNEIKSLRLRLEGMRSWVALYLNNAKYWPIEIPGDGGKFDKMAFYKDFCKALE